MPTALLDYTKPDIQIKMKADSPIEQAYRVKACAKEPWTVAFIEAMGPRDCFWDIGACVGSYGLLANALGHAVVAIEPLAANFQQLLNNLIQNPKLGTNFYALQVALGAETKPVTFKQNGMPGYCEVEDGLLSLQVMQHRLDELVGIMVNGAPLPFPTHIKIDVDGHELGVIAGAEKTLHDERCKKLLVEVKVDLHERITDVLTGWGWKRIAVHDKRNNLPIVGVRYEEYAR